MKKQIAVIAGLAVLSTGALASKARLQALGEDTYGSMFLDDARNVTLNPAHLNFHKDFVTLEWGDTSNGGDTSSAPRAEGGMFKASGNMVYGLYFGDESDTANAIRGAAMTTNAVVESNNTSFYVAGDAGVQWGVKFTHHSYEDEANDKKSDAQRITLGMVSGNIDAFAKIGLLNKAENGASEFEGKGSYQLGLTYGMGDVDYMLEVRSIVAEEADGDEFKANYTRLGVAKSYKLNDKASVWTSAWYNMDNTECDMTLCSDATVKVGSGEEKNTYLPVKIAMEVQAKDWLTLRGSITHEVMGTTEDDNGDKATREDTTTVAAGASLVFGDLSFDGMIGNGGETCKNAAGTEVQGNDTTGTCTPDADSKTGMLNTENLMSRVSMTYKF